MRMHFSTDEAPSRDRFDYWQEVVCRTYAHCSGVAEDRDGFVAATSVRDFGFLEMSDVVSAAIRYDRQPSDLRKGPRDDFFVSLMIQGAADFEQNGQASAHHSGDILIYDAAKPYVYHHRLNYRSILMRVPRPVISARLIDLDALGGTVLPGSSAYGRLVGSLMRETYSLGEMEQEIDGAAFSAPTLDMITAAIRGALGDRDDGGRGHSVLLKRIMHYMKSSLADATLTLEAIARNQNVSARTLSRLFAEAGTTPMGWLQAQRLAWAYNALAERRITTVTEVAFAAGFSDLSHFSRSFKKAFGRTPNTLLSNH